MQQTRDGQMERCEVCFSGLYWQKYSKQLVDAQHNNLNTEHHKWPLTLGGPNGWNLTCTCMLCCNMQHNTCILCLKWWCVVTTEVLRRCHMIVIRLSYECHKVIWAPWWVRCHTCLPLQTEKNTYMHTCTPVGLTQEVWSQQQLWVHYTFSSTTGGSHDQEVSPSWCIEDDH